MYRKADGDVTSCPQIDSLKWGRNTPVRKEQSRPISGESKKDGIGAPPKISGPLSSLAPENFLWSSDSVLFPVKRMRGLSEPSLKYSCAKEERGPEESSCAYP